MIDLILTNLQNIAIGESLFVIAYLGNMLISIWYNTGILNQTFDFSKLKKSAIKILCFGGGIGLTSIVVSTLPIFADSVGFTIAEEFTEAFATITIIAMFLTAACKYVAEAITKAKKILTSDSVSTS